MLVVPRSTVRLPTCNCSSAKGGDLLFLAAGYSSRVGRLGRGICCCAGLVGFQSAARVNQTAEEPVVSKTARVAEEVVVREDATEYTETVRDDMRQEQVALQDVNQRRSWSS
jgi:hypothetical protein